MQQIVIARAEAKRCGLVRYFTGKPCLRGHTAERFTSTGQCSVCIDAQGKAWRAANPEKAASSQAAWRGRQPKPKKKPRTGKTHRELNRIYRLRKRFPNANIDIRCIPLDPKVQWAIYYEAKKDQIAAKQLEYRERNRDALKQAWVDWYSKNRSSQVEKATMRRAKVLRATPSWLTTDQLAQITATYLLAARLEAETGVPHHVDHIVPISGKTVCGLHVPWNLRAIPWVENLRKSNKLIDC